MARQSNIVDTVTVTISTTPQIKRCLEKLAATGAFGKNVAETASILIREKVRDFVEKGVLLNIKDFDS